MKNQNTIFDFRRIGKYYLFGFDYHQHEWGFAHWFEDWCTHSQMYPTIYHAKAALYDYLQNELNGRRYED